MQDGGLPAALHRDPLRQCNIGMDEKALSSQADPDGISIPRRVDEGHRNIIMDVHLTLVDRQRSRYAAARKPE
jgi:hypothetical protein